MDAHYENINGKVTFVVM